MDMTSTETSFPVSARLPICTSLFLASLRHARSGVLPRQLQQRILESALKFLIRIQMVDGQAVASLAVRTALALRLMAAMHTCFFVCVTDGDVQRALLVFLSYFPLKGSEILAVKNISSEANQTHLM